MDSGTRDFADFYRKWGGNMYRMLFIARSNLVRKKNDVVTLFMLMMLSTLLLYISISVLWRTPLVIDTACEEFNTADFLYVSACPETERIGNVLTGRDEVSQIEYSEGVELTAAYHKENGEEKESEVLIEPIESVGELCRIPEIGADKKYETILLPYYMKSSEQIAEGDIFYLTIGETEYAFEVGGFVQDTMFATPLNVSVIRCYITQDYYKDILSREQKAQDMVTYLYKVKLNEGIGARKFAGQVVPELSREVPESANYMNIAMDRETMKVGVAFLSNICMVILLIFSVLLVCIALIIAWCSIKNFIAGNLRNIGILMTSGYTKRQLMGNTCMEMLILSMTGGIAGLTAGGFLNVTIGNLTASMIGLKWNQPFDGVTAAIVFILMNLIVLTVTMLCCKNYNRIEILDALRGGIGNHNFCLSPIPLEKSILPVPLSLGLKNILGEKRKSMAITGIVALLSFACCIGFALFQNFALAEDTLQEMVGVEIGDAILSGQNVEEAGRRLEAWDEIRKVLYYDNRSTKLTTGEEETVVTCDFWEDTTQNEYVSLIEGRLPQYDNEIAVTAIVAKQLGIGKGDVIYAEGDEGRCDYMISGIYQQMNQLGICAVMTMEGAVRINGSSTVNRIYIYLEDGVSCEQMERKIEEEFPSLDMTDAKKSMELTLGSVRTVMTLLCVVFAGITIVIVALIIILLIRAKVTREWKQYGVYKALGFTTGELIKQIQMSSLPVFLAGSVLGACLSAYLLNPLVQTCLSMAGIVQSDLTIQIRWMFLSIIIIMTTAFLSSFLCAYRVRKAEPVKMIAEE